MGPHCPECGSLYEWTCGELEEHVHAPKIYFCSDCRAMFILPPEEVRALQEQLRPMLQVQDGLADLQEEAEPLLELLNEELPNPFVVEILPEEVDELELDLVEELEGPVLSPEDLQELEQDRLEGAVRAFNLAADLLSIGRDQYDRLRGHAPGEPAEGPSYEQLFSIAQRTFRDSLQRFERAVAILGDLGGLEADQLRERASLNMALARSHLHWRSEQVFEN